MPNMVVKSAVNKKVNSHDNSGVHITTLDFGKVCVSKFLKVRQGDRFNINYNMFCRLAPMAVPTYGRFMLRTSAFWVPRRVVWPSYGKWLERENDPSIVSSPLSIPAYVLSSLFYNESNGLMKYDQGSPDIKFRSVDSSPASLSPRRFTAKGRALYSIIRSLGYVVFPFKDLKAYPDSLKSMSFDASPLLAFLRCFFDWLYPSTFVQQQGWSKYFRYDSHTFSALELKDLLGLLFVSYDHDFYVDAWQNFDAPNPREDESIDVNAFTPQSSRLRVTTSSTDGTVMSKDNTAFEEEMAAGGTKLLSGYGLRMLQSIADYWTRHNLVGSRFLERAKVQYGFVSKENRHDYSDFLKTWSDDVMMMDVTQTSASTDSSQLGEQAGKGIGKGGGDLAFEASEDGYLVFISYLVPKIGYVQGIAPWVRLPLSPFDEYTPEIEDVGMQPLPKSEMFAEWSDGSILYSWETNPNTPYTVDGVFGFVPRYNEYKRGFDCLSGDFIIKHLSTGGAMDAYHTFRMFQEPQNGYVSGESLAFAQNDAEFRQVGNQYDRVFSKNPLDSEGQEVADHFYVYFGWNIKRYNTMKPMLATIPLFDKSGREVNASYLGEQLH